MSRPSYGFGDIVYRDGICRGGPGSSLVAKLQYSGPTKVVWYVRQPQLLDDDYEDAFKMIDDYLELAQTGTMELPPVLHG